MEGFPGEGRLGHFQGGRTLGNGIQGTDHQPQDEVHHGRPVFVQGILHQFDDPHDPGEHPESENAQHREIGQVHMEEFLDGADDGHIQPEDQQHGGTGDPRQYHGTDGDHGTDEDVSSQERGQMGNLYIGPLAAGGVQRRNHQHQHDPQYQEQDPADPAEAFLLFPDNERKGENGKAQEQGTQLVDPAGEETGNHQHRRPHADDPAHAQLSQEPDALPF